MFKKLIAPIQSFLLKNKQCVACGRFLEKQETRQIKGKTLIFCKCGRIYVKEPATYRRALFEEV